MAIPTSPAVSVPMLRPKLGILYLFSRIKGDTALGRAFKSGASPNGITDKAIRNWVDGENNRPADHVPADRFAHLVEIYVAALPGQRTPLEVQALLTSENANGLWQAFASGAPKEGWMALVTRAGPAQATLVSAGRPGTMGMTSRKAQFSVTHAWIRVPIDELFRFKLQPRGGWLAIIQWGEEGWFALDLGPDAAVFTRDTVAQVVPDGFPFEENRPSARRYIFVESPEPFPPDLKEILDTSASARASLDATTLRRIAHLAAETKGLEITSLDVAFFSR